MVGSRHKPKLSLFGLLDPLLDSNFSPDNCLIFEEKVEFGTLSDNGLGVHVESLGKEDALSFFFKYLRLATFKLLPF